MVLLVLWTVAPVAACVQTARQAAQRSCCNDMQVDCTEMMSMDSSCCQLRHNQAPVEVAAEFVLVHQRDFIALAHDVDLPPQTDNMLRRSCASHAVVPTASPGIGSILRI